MVLPSQSGRQHDGVKSSVSFLDTYLTCFSGVVSMAYLTGLIIQAWFRNKKGIKIIMLKVESIQVNLSKSFS